MPFSIVESNWRATNPPLMPTISSNTSNQNFEIAVFLSVVDFQIENMFLRRKLPHNPQGKGFSYALGVYKNDVGTMHNLLIFSFRAGYFVSKKLS